MSVKSIKADLERTRRELQELQEDLPQFEQLLGDNEADERDLKKGKAPFDQLAAAKSRVLTAIELLNDHKASIEEQEAQVQVLEAQLEQAENLDKIRKLSGELDKLQSAYRVDLEDLYANTGRRVQALIDRRRQWRELLGDFDRLASSWGAPLARQDSSDNRISAWRNLVTTLQAEGIDTGPLTRVPGEAFMPVDFEVLRVPRPTQGLEGRLATLLTKELEDTLARAAR